MAAHASGTVAVDGKWNIRWRPESSPSQSGVVTLAVDGGHLSVEVDSTAGSGRLEGVAHGNRLLWSGLLGESPIPLSFDLVVEGDMFSGTVTAAMGPRGGPAVVFGTRVGSDVTITVRDGNDALAETLVASGIEYAFGYCCAGPSLAPLLERVPNMAGRNELSAAWISYGYNRVKRRAASVAVLWGVGMLHAAPVVHAAKVDSTPLLCLAVEAGGPEWDMRDILQDAGDLYSVLRPLTKYIKRIGDAEDLPLAVRQSVIASSTGKFGPAVLSLSSGPLREPTRMRTEKLVLPEPPAASESDVERTLEMLRAAKAPVLLAGAGVQLADARAELREFAEATGIPVVSSGPASRGVLPDDHPLYAGDMSAWGGFGTGLKIAEEADLWLAVGFSFSQTATLSWTVSKPETVIHVDIEESQLGRIFQPTLGIVADSKRFLDQLHRQWTAWATPRPDHANSPRVAQIATVKRAQLDRLAGFGGDPIYPVAIGQILADEVPDDALIVNDEGFMVPGMVFRGNKYPSGFASALGFHYASLGSALPVAIGAKLADPDRPVISVSGDAGFYYNCSDLSLLAEHDIKLTCIVNNNLGLYGGQRGRANNKGGIALPPVWTDLPDTTDIAGVARSFGVEAERVETFEQLAPAIRRALAADGPYVVEVLTGASATMHLHHLSHLADEVPRKLGHGDVLKGSWPS